MSFHAIVAKGIQNRHNILNTISINVVMISIELASVRQSPMSILFAKDVLCCNTMLKIMMVIMTLVFDMVCDKYC